MRLPSNSRSSFAGSRGSVTAEFALLMPSVALIIALAVGVLGLQVERLKQVSIAASAARALGRGETEADVRSGLIAVDPALRMSIEYLENLVCAIVARDIRVASLPSVEVSERQCFRKGGL